MEWKVTVTIRTYRRSTKLPPCTLSPDDIRRLATLLAVGLPAEVNHSIRISYDLAGVEITENDVELFLHNTDLPPAITDLSMMLNNAPGKFSSVRFSSRDAQTFITGDNLDWVVGRDAELSSFIKNKRPRFWFMHSWRFPATYLLLDILNGVLITYLTIGKNHDFLLHSLSNLITAIVWIMLLSWLYLGLLSPYSKIVTTTRQSWTIKKEITLAEAITIVLTVLLLVFAIIGPLRK